MYVKSVNPKMFGVLCKWPVVWIRMIYRNAVNNISQKTSGAKVLFTIMIFAIKLYKRVIISPMNGEILLGIRMQN